MKHPVRMTTMPARTLALALICTIALAGSLSANSDTPAVAGFIFEQYEVDTGSARHQTVLTGFLLGGRVAELAVVNIDENDDRRLRIYAFDDVTWVPRLDEALRPEALFVDVANIGGRDDLVVPQSDGFQVFTQMSDGAFADPVKIGPSSGKGWSYGRGGYRHSPWNQGGVHEMDYDRDGRSDLAFWSGDRFEVHLQDEHGRFAPEARTFTAAVAPDGGRNPCARHPGLGFDAFEACYESDHSALTTGDMKEQVPHALTDRDGKQDVLMHHPSTTEPQRVTLLIAHRSPGDGRDRR